MATLINNVGVQHYANKMVLAENRKVGSKSLPTALSDIDNLIDEMKTHFDTEYGSALDMKLENNENVFSVGTGTNVDKRSEVENSFTDVELSGNSLVNCVLIDKLYEDSNYLEFENSPVITKGNITLKSRQLNYVRFCPKIECGVIKPNTKYTLIFNVTSNNLTGTTNLTHTNTATLTSAFSFVNTIQPKQTGIFKYVLTSTADISSCNTLLRTIIWNDCSTKDETITFSLMILEGDWTNKPLPQYFEGIKSIGEKEDGNHKIEILSRSKNLLDESFYKVNSYYTPSNTSANESTKSYVYSKVIKLKPKTKYTLTHLGGIEVPPNKYYRFGITDYDKKEENVYCMPFSLNNTSSTDVAISTKTSNIFTTNERGLVCIRCYNNSSLKELLDNSMNKFVLLEGTETSNGYLKGELNKKEISLNEPLRGLPNGVKDSIELIDGKWKLVRRCGEVVFDANTPLSGYASNETKEHIYALVKDCKKGHGNILVCDRFACVGKSWEGGSVNTVTTSNFNSGQIGFTFDIGKYGSVSALNEWLSQNPTKVIYELATPIVKDISPVTLQCWKNGTISIDEVLPVETTHTVALNKPAQIKRNIEELTALRNKVQALEEQYDKIALEQAYQLDLVNHSYELDYNR